MKNTNTVDSPKTATKTATAKNAIRSFLLAQLKQMNIEPTDKNVLEHGLCEEEATVLHITGDTAIILYSEGFCDGFLNIVNISGAEILETYEL